jgi:putative hydrolase of the HAD superfamily
MTRPPLEAVLFDLDDTLHDDTATYRRAARGTASEIARERNVDEEALFAAYVAQAESFWKNLGVERFGTPLVGLRTAMWHAALRDAGIDDVPLAERAAEAYNRYRRDHLRLWPGALPLLRRLRERGCRLALVTNGFAETHREKIVLLDLEDAFDAVFIADEVGMLKPDTRLFRLACERLGVAPAASAMVGDRYERDVRGAADAGLYTVWLNVRNESVPPGAPPPDATVTTLDEVEGALPPTVKRSLSP